MMNPGLKIALDKVLGFSPAQPIFHWRAARRLTVLAYHGVEDAESFARHLDYLRRQMSPVSLDEVLDAIAGRRGLPRRAVLVTFDDGHRSVLETGAPLLAERGIPAVVFVVAGLLDSQTPFWWMEVEDMVRRGGRVAGVADHAPRGVVRALKQLPDEDRLAAMVELRRTAAGPPAAYPQLRREELRRLESMGIAVGNHSLTHPCLPRCSDRKIEEEIRRAHAILSEALGRAPLSFAYPNGDADARTVRALHEAGYRAAFLFDHRVNPLPCGDALRISRVRVDSTTPLDRFRIIVSGLHPAIHHARQAA